MPNYSPATSVKINYLDNLINEHKDWGSAKLQKAIIEKFGSALKKNYLLQEAKVYRESQKIEQPKAVLSDTNRLRAILRDGGYTRAEKEVVLQQAKSYDKEQRKNFITSEVLKAAAKQHREWIDSMTKSAREISPNLKEASKLVEQRLNKLLMDQNYDPFLFLREQETPGVIISGLVKIRKLNRDYTERRREKAIRRREEIASMRW